MENTQSNLLPSNNEQPTKISRIPKPFSIESLIAHQSPQNQQLLTNYPTQPNNVPEVAIINHSTGHGYVESSFGLPPFPLYNPWMGYLTQTATERLSQFFSRSDDKLTHFLDVETSKRDTRFLVNSADVIKREKLAQYFVNNIRDSNKDRLSEFLISAKNNDYNNLLISDNKQCNSEQQFYVNQSSVTQYSDDVNLLECNIDDKDIDLESDDSLCDLSLTLSPNEKNQGSKTLFINNYYFFFLFYNAITFHVDLLIF